MRNNQQSKLLNEAEYELKYRADRGMPRKSASKGLVSLFGLLQPILKPEREKNAWKAQTYEVYWYASSRLAQCNKGINFRIRNPETFLLVEPGSWALDRNTAQGTRTPTNNWNLESGIQVPLTKDPESRSWTDSRLSWIPLKRVMSTLSSW